MRASSDDASPRVNEVFFSGQEGKKLRWPENCYAYARAKNVYEYSGFFFSIRGVNQ